MPFQSMGPLLFSYFKALFNITDLAKYQVTINYISALRDEVTGEWKRIHNENISDVYCPPNVFRAMKSRRMRQSGPVARVGKRKGVHTVLVGKREGNITWKTQDKWEDNIEMGLQELGWEGMSQIDLARNRYRWQSHVTAVMNFWLRKMRGIS